MSRPFDGVVWSRCALAALLCSAALLVACGGGKSEATDGADAGQPQVDAPPSSDGAGSDTGSDSPDTPDDGSAAPPDDDGAAVPDEPTDPGATAQRPTAGVLFYANVGQTTDPLILANPSIAAGFYMLYWSDIEAVEGSHDWSKLDANIAEWKAAGKGVAIRVLWSTSGYWSHPQAKTPTPQWVWNAGAKFAYHADSGTEVPLFWDPIYLARAQRFLAAVGARYDADPAVMFIDATPAAETNPYRFGTIDANDPGFRTVFTGTAASDGRTYSASLWASTVSDYIGTVKSHFPTLPVLITLNKSGMPGEPSRLQAVGDQAADLGLWVGQNGLKGTSYSGAGAGAWLTWGQRTQVFFETDSATGGSTGTMQEVVDACQHAGCNWLNVYYSDVFKATPGTATYSADYEAALKDLAATVDH